MIDLGKDSERVTRLATRAGRRSVHPPYESSGLMPYEGLGHNIEAMDYQFGILVWIGLHI